MPKRILLADDSITIQKVVELTFSDADYEVTAVNNGAKAIAKLGDMRPDIILSDIIMPEKNGYEVCEYVKSHPEFRNIPVVLLTGTFEPFDPDRAEKAGCDAVVTKPFESQSLIQKVEELIAQAAASAPAAAPEPEPEPAPSPWSAADTEVVPLPGRSPFTTSSGSFPTADPFAHDSDIFNAAPAPSGTTEMPFETAGAEEFSGETRAFPKMSFEEMQQMAAPPAAPEPPPAAPEPSPWDEQPEPAFGGETRAFPKMTFDEMLAAQPATPEASPWDEPPQEAEALPWETPAAEEPAWASPAETSAPEEAAPVNFAPEEEAMPFATDSIPEPSAETASYEATPYEAAAYEEPSFDETPYAEAPAQDEVPQPTAAPSWAPAAEAEAQAEPAEPPMPSPVLAPETPSLPIAARDLTDEQIDRIARRVVELMSDHVVRNIAWEVIPDLAEMVVKERIRQLEAEA
jgi:CheY-like chemotaxis protein